MAMGSVAINRWGAMARQVIKGTSIYIQVGQNWSFFYLGYLFSISQKTLK